MRFLRSLLYVLVVAATLWATAALYYDLPIVWLRVPLALLYLIVIAGLLFRRKPWICLLAFAMVCSWWFTLRPSDMGDWQRDVDRTAWAVVDGDKVTIHNIRNFEYRSETDYTPHWESRTYDLSKIRGIDIFLTHWDAPLIAHPIVSFEFEDSLPAAFSIEVRKTKGQSYATLPGIFRQFTLIYTIADERDVIRLRTNYRHGEEVEILRTRAGPGRARAMFFEYVKAANDLHAHPQWYNAITNSCTTGIQQHAVATDTTTPTPWDWRVVLNGTADKMLYDRGDLAGDNLPFAEFLKRVHINDVARQADKDPEFSRRIREGRPGF